MVALPLPLRMTQRITGVLIRVFNLIGKTQVSFPNPPSSIVLLRMNPQRQKGNREKTSRNPSGKTMILLCFSPVLLPPDA